MDECDHPVIEEGAVVSYDDAVEALQTPRNGVVGFRPAYCPECGERLVGCVELTMIGEIR